MTLEELNALGDEAAARVLSRCCGSTRWARAMTARRPFPDTATLCETADRVWAGLDAADWLEAFAAHPRIGDRLAAGAVGTDRAGQAGGAGRAGRAGEAGEAGEEWSAREQAGMAAATDEVRRRLAEANRRY